VPYYVYSNMQDDGTMRGAAWRPRNAGAGYNGSGNHWDHGLGGCESGHTIPDPVDPNIVWSTCYGNKVTRYDHRRRSALGRAGDDHPRLAAADSKYRCHWTAPIAIDPFESQQRVSTAATSSSRRRTAARAGRRSARICRRRIQQDHSSGGIVGDNLGQFAPEVIFAIAFRRVEKGLVWAGPTTARSGHSRDGGASGTTFEEHHGMPAWGMVTKIEAVAVRRRHRLRRGRHHLMDSREPYIFKNQRYGATWNAVNGDLPNSHPLSYVRAVAENPNKQRHACSPAPADRFYYSKDDGAHWTELAAGLPHAPVSWVVVQKQFHDVVVRRMAADSTSSTTSRRSNRTRLRTQMPIC
jgi:hypothetical protein